MIPIQHFIFGFQKFQVNSINTGFSNMDLLIGSIAQMSYFLSGLRTVKNPDTHFKFLSPFCQAPFS